MHLAVATHNNYHAAIQHAALRHQCVSPAIEYLQLSSLFIRWGSVVIISAVLLLPRAFSRHGCAGGGQVYVAQHRMTIFISLCYHIIYLLDPAENRDDCVQKTCSIGMRETGAACWQTVLWYHTQDCGQALYVTSKIGYMLLGS